MNIFKVGRYYIQMKGIVELNSYMSFLLTFFYISVLLWRHKHERRVKCRKRNYVSYLTEFAISVHCKHLSMQHVLFIVELQNHAFWKDVFQVAIFSARLILIRLSIYSNLTESPESTQCSKLTDVWWAIVFSPWDWNQYQESKALVPLFSDVPEAHFILIFATKTMQQRDVALRKVLTII